MNKAEYIKSIKLPSGLDLDGGTLYPMDTIKLAPDLSRWGETPATITVTLPSATPYTQANAAAVRQAITANSVVISTWQARQRAYRHHPDYRQALKLHEAQVMAMAAGLLHDEHGGYTTRGDHNSIRVVDVQYKPSELRQSHASGKMLALVAQTRHRVYANSSKFHSSDRVDTYLCGQNENGNYFLHPVPGTVGSTVRAALAWIWDGNQIVARHGDVALAEASRPINQQGTATEAESLLSGHVVTGVIYRNGATYVRDAVLHHTRDQHPDVTTPTPGVWYKVVIGRRSTRQPGTRD